MYTSRHSQRIREQRTQPIRQPQHRGRHAGVPQPGNPGYDSRPGSAYQILLPILAGLLGLAVVLLILYRTLFE